MFEVAINQKSLYNNHNHPIHHRRLKADPSYTPAGINVLDGTFAVFGYVVDGQDLLDELQEGDVIQSAKLVSGSEYLKQP